MLFGQNLGGSHDDGLIAVVDGDERTEQGHERLARADVALEQAVHLPARAHVGPNLFNDPLLCAGQFEGQVVVVECVEELAYPAEDKAAYLLAPVAGIAQEAELDVEEFVELESCLGSPECFGRSGEVNATDGLVVGHEVVGVDNALGQGLGQGFGDEFEEVPHHLGNGRRVEESLLHAVGGVVVGPKGAAIRQTSISKFTDRKAALFGGRGAHGWLDVGVVDLQATVKDCGLAKDDVWGAHLIGVSYELQALEPHEFDESAAVGEARDDATARALAHFLHVDYLARELDVGHVAVDFSNAVGLAAVDVAVGVVTEHVAHGLDAHLLLEELGTLWAYALQVFN